MKLVPFVLCATGLALLFLSGCRKEEEKAHAALPAHAPASYMNDPVFRKQLEEKRKELSAIVAERRPLADRMQALVREHGEDLAALRKIPEWNELHKKVVALNKKYEEVRARQLKVVRERIAPGRSGRDSASPLGMARKNGEAESFPLQKKAETRSTAVKDISK